jgi:hypothetical protein
MKALQSIQGFFTALLRGLEALLSTCAKPFAFLLRALEGFFRACVQRTRSAASSMQLRDHLRPMRRILRGASLGLALSAVVWIVGASILERVPPGMVAVEQINWGEGAGIVEKDHDSGLHLTWGGRSTWHPIAGGTQFVIFGWENLGGTEPMLAVAIQGGVPAEVNVCIPYRIQPGQAWRVVEAGLKNDYPRRVTAIARRVLLEELGQLSTDDLANSDARAQVEDAVLTRLNTDLEEVHLEAMEVVIGAVYFEPSFESKLHEKQLATQTELTNQSLSALKAAELQREFSLHEVASEQKALAAEWDLQIAQARIELERELHALQRAAQKYPHEVAAAEEVNEAQSRAEGKRLLSAAKALSHNLWNSELTASGSADPLILDYRQAATSLAEAHQESRRNETTLEAEFTTAKLNEALAHAQAVGALERESLAAIHQVQSEAKSEEVRLRAQGQLVLAQAGALSERLHNEVLEGPGGRLYLAREAAQNLNIKRVVLDPTDPRVPNILDLDELLDLLVGSLRP